MWCQIVLWFSDRFGNIPVYNAFLFTPGSGGESWERPEGVLTHSRYWISKCHAPAPLVITYCKQSRETYITSTLIALDL